MNNSISQNLSENRTVQEQIPAAVTLLKVVCGNLILSTDSCPLFYLLGDSTAGDVLLHVSQRGWSGDQRRRAKIAAGDGAPFLLLRCAYSFSKLNGESAVCPEGEGSVVDRGFRTDDVCVGVVQAEGKEMNKNKKIASLPSSLYMSIRLPCGHTSSSSRLTSVERQENEHKEKERKEQEKEDVQLKAEGARMAQIVLVPEMIERSVQCVLSELLQGFG